MIGSNLNSLVDYLKEQGFNAEDTVAICLLCKDESKAEIMLEYCKRQTELELSNLLEKGVEIYNS